MSGPKKPSADAAKRGKALAKELLAELGPESDERKAEIEKEEAEREKKIEEALEKYHKKRKT